MRDVLGRFWGHVAVGTSDECWLWQACTHRNGYGSFKVGTGRKVPSHRFAFEINQMAPVTSGLLVLHSCDVRDCVNPAHLREGTMTENARECVERGRNPMRNKTHCSRGHAYTETNTYWAGRERNWRQCRVCRSTHGRNRRLRQKGSAA